MWWFLSQKKKIISRLILNIFIYWDTILNYIITFYFNCYTKEKYIWR